MRRRFDIDRPGRAVASVLSFVALLAVAPRALHAQGAPASGMIASLTVQLVATDDGLQVTEALNVQGGSAGMRWPFPLFVPEGGSAPVMTARVEGQAGGTDVRSSGGASAQFAQGVLYVSSPSGVGGRWSVEIRYDLPVDDDRMTGLLTPGFPLSRVQFVTKRSATYAAQIRPLVPYNFREDVEEDGTWQTLTPVDGLPAGATLRTAVAHLPKAFDAYRASGLVVAGLALFGLALVVIARRRRS